MKFRWSMHSGNHAKVQLPSANIESEKSENIEGATTARTIATALTTDRNVELILTSKRRQRN